MKAQGSVFVYDNIVMDSATWQEKGCLSSSMVTDMFYHATEGTVIKFTKEDTITKDIVVLPLGTGKVSWSNSSVNLGGMILYPDKDCTEHYLEKTGIGSDSQGNRMLLSTEALLEAHVGLQARFVTGIADRRRLQDRTAIADSNTVSYSDLDMGKKKHYGDGYDDDEAPIKAPVAAPVAKPFKTPIKATVPTPPPMTNHGSWGNPSVGVSTRSDGICQDSGLIFLGTQKGYPLPLHEECLEMCAVVPGVSGCEMGLDADLGWGCYVHTAKIDGGGNGAAGHSCYLYEI